MYDVELIDIKDEWIKIIDNVKSMSKKEGNSVEIGIFGDQSLVKIATENEFGDPPRPNRKWKIPERSFLRHVFDRDKDDLTLKMQNMASDILIGKIKITESLEELGTLFENKVKDFISGDYYRSSKPNHPITVRIKGHDHPLIQIGKLYSVITHRITGKPIRLKKK